MNNKKLILNKKVALGNIIDKFISHGAKDTNTTTEEVRPAKRSIDPSIKGVFRKTSLTEQEKMQRLNALSNLKTNQDLASNKKKSETSAIVKERKVIIEDKSSQVERYKEEKRQSQIERKKILSTENSDDKQKVNKKHHHPVTNTEWKKEKISKLSSIRGKNRRIDKVVKKKDTIFIDKKSITVRNLSVLLSEPKKFILRALKGLDSSLDENAVLTQEIIELLALELGYDIKYKLSANEKLLSDISNKKNESSDNLIDRPPVVTIMGHIDHGKTTLLDALRQSNVVAGECGGITQDIGVYQIVSREGKKITVLDTPGHAAFTAMRMRGATLTDIVILVIAADDGVNEQTIEAIKHIKAADVPIIVAINKIDKANSNPQKIMSDLIRYGVTVEKMGGNVMHVEISAKNKINLDQLEEMILLQAEIMELKANAIDTKGSVIESRLDKRCGSLSTLLITDGKLETGQIVVAEQFFGKVKWMTDSYGKKVKSATPGTPVEIIGLNGVPDSGANFCVVDNEKQAKAMIESNCSSHNNDTITSHEKPRNYFEEDGCVKINILIKGNIYGSVEAVSSSLKAIKQENAELIIIHQGVGDITESDVELAKITDAYILGFRVKSNKSVKDYKKVIISSVIYDVIDGMNEVITNLFTKKTEDRPLGTAEVKETFTLSNSAIVAGCNIKSGIIRHGCDIKIIRHGNVLARSRIKTLKSFKENVKELRTGQDCGILLDSHQDLVAAGDILESFTTQ